MDLIRIEKLENDLTNIRQGLWVQKLSSKEKELGLGYYVYKYCANQIVPEEFRDVDSFKAYLLIAKHLSQDPGFIAENGPVYHNHIHACEVMIFATALFLEEYKEIEKRVDLGPRFLISVMAHDLSHPGRPALEHQELEQKSVQAFRDVMRLARSLPDPEHGDSEEHTRIQEYLSSAEFLDALFNDLQNIVLGTEMSVGFTENYGNYHTLHDRRQGGDRRGGSRPGIPERRQLRVNLPEDSNTDLVALKKLANEADIGASCFPMGYTLGKALAEELKNHAIGTWAGRLYFLKTFGRFDSRASRSLGLDVYIRNQVHVIQTLGVESLERLVEEQDPEIAIKLIRDIVVGMYVH